MSRQLDSFPTQGPVHLADVSINHLHTSGSATLNHCDVVKLSTFGPAKLTESNIRIAQISGGLSASDCKLGDVQTWGSVDFDRCRISRNLNVVGVMSLKNSQIAGNVVCSGSGVIAYSKIQHSVEFSGQCLEVSDSSIEEIIVKPMRSSSSYRFVFFGFGFGSAQQKDETQDQDKPQKVILSGDSCHVKTIQFKTKKPGIVILNESADLPEVINGKIE